MRLIILLKLKKDAKKRMSCLFMGVVEQSKQRTKHVLLGMELVFGNVTHMMYILIHTYIYIYIYRDAYIYILYIRFFYPQSFLRIQYDDIPIEVVT